MSRFLSVFTVLIMLSSNNLYANNFISLADAPNRGCTSEVDGVEYKFEFADATLIDPFDPEGTYLRITETFGGTPSSQMLKLPNPRVTLRNSTYRHELVNTRFEDEIHVQDTFFSNLMITPGRRTSGGGTAFPPSPGGGFTPGSVDGVVFYNNIIFSTAYENSPELITNNIRGDYDLYKSRRFPDRINPDIDPNNRYIPIADRIPIQTKTVWTNYSDPIYGGIIPFFYDPAVDRYDNIKIAPLSCDDTATTDRS